MQNEIWNLGAIKKDKTLTLNKQILQVYKIQSIKEMLRACVFYSFMKVV